MNSDAHGSRDLTDLLSRWANGDKQAFEELVSIVYDRLHLLSGKHMAKERSGHTLRPTALLNECVAELIEAKVETWNDRGHFFATAARIMRQILVRHARSRNSEKRGGKRVRIALQGDEPATDRATTEILELHAALQELEQSNPLRHRVIELRYFGGLTIEETAQAMEISDTQVWRETALAKAFLGQALGDRRLEEGENR